jgi:AcrR family transcriptional regulator
MPLPRFQRLPPEKRAQLLDAATKEFAERGYETASLNSILANAGLGKSSYYYYFADKEDLYATVIEDVLKRLDSEIPAPTLETLDAASFWPALEAYAVAATRSVVRSPEQVALLRPLQAMWRNPSPRLAPLVAKTRGQYRLGIQVGQRLGCVRTDLDLETLIAIVEAADHALDERFMLQGDLTPEKLQAHSRVVLDTLKRLLLPAFPPKA